MPCAGAGESQGCLVIDVSTDKIRLKQSAGVMLPGFRKGYLTETIVTSKFRFKMAAKPWPQDYRGFCLSDGRNAWERRQRTSWVQDGSNLLV
jgi:hypothetical protein